MSEQDRYIPGVPCWIDTTQPDPAAATAFYGELFEWELEDVMPPGSPMPYLIARLAGGDVGAITGQPAGTPPAAAAWNTYIWVESADQTAAKVRAAGGTVLMEPDATGDAGRMAVFADREGAVFSVWEPARHRGAAVVNEPGALNFNNLHVRDLDAARAFYGAVFGWETIEIGPGLGWALPGYGDFLERRTPGMRESMAAMGAPDRFEDVVASLAEIPSDQPDTPAHWSVTFGADDADRVAARAVELGGRVDVPPFSAPWVRTTVITDPQGATFTASRFAPENKDLAEAAGAAVAE
jgi:hypothetical protein